MAHFEAVVGDVGPASSFERRHAFLTAGPEMVSFLQGLGVGFVHCPGYSDYYSNAKGGARRGPGDRAGAVGRPGARRRGSTSCSPGLAQSLGLAVMTNEARSLSQLQPQHRRVRHRRPGSRSAPSPPGLGGRRCSPTARRSSGRCSPIALDRGIPVWTEAPLDDLVVEDGRVVGRAHACATARRCRSGPARACCSPAGGFAHNPRDARASTAATSPTRAKWSIANPGDTGEAHRDRDAARRADRPDGRGVVAARRPARAGSASRRSTRPASGPARSTSTPTGERFVNESNSYMEVGKAMYERDKTSRAVPCWLIFDDRYRKRYAHLRSQPRPLPAQAARERPAQAGVDARRPRPDVRHRRRRPGRDGRALQPARRATGVDPDYGRGESAYNRALGDPNHKVHPCLGPIDEAAVLRRARSCPATSARAAAS